jgi:hypothetical protein
MRLALNVLLVVLFLFSNAPRSSGSDNSDQIVAHAGDTNRLTFAEAMENSNDERMITSFTSASQLSSSQFFLIPNVFIEGSSEEMNPPKGDLKIYKLNVAFLI